MNSFMAMPPGTQYARKGIDGIVKNVDKRAYHNNLLAITGPTFLQNQVYNHLERKDKSFFLFLSVTDDLFDFSNHVQTPGQNDDVKRTRAQRVVIYQNGEYRRHAKTTGSQSYNDKYYNCQVFGEPEPSKKCHEELENSATVITALHFTQFVIIAGTVICTYLFVG